MDNSSPFTSHQFQLLNRFAELLAHTADAVGDWEEIFHDIRRERDCSLDRTILLYAGTRQLIRLPTNAVEVQTRLLQLNELANDREWYGLSIHINNVGHCDVQYNFDPNCIETFAADEKAHRPF
ncbi:MAG: hypothetical protein J0M17_12510 [Planctomycetes bacterium]|nr:hypothetical protein [Planctomycetota bacterium]